MTACNCPPKDCRWGQIGDRGGACRMRATSTIAIPVGPCIADELRQFENPADLETSGQPPAHKRARKRAMLNVMLPRVIAKADAAEKEFRRAFRRWDKLRSEERAIVRTLDRLDAEDRAERIAAASAQDLPAMLRPQAD